MKLFREQDDMKKNGQAIILLIFFMAIIVMVVSASVSLMISSATGQTVLSKGNQAKLVAESGVENALLRLLRNPDYTGETIQLSQGETDIAVTGNQTDKTITSRSIYLDSIYTVEVQVKFNTGILEIISWKEI
jgi:type II secretory pathway component PulK